MLVNAGKDVTYLPLLCSVYFVPPGNAGLPDLISFASMLTSATSLITTPTLLPSLFSRMCFKVVVLPTPRNPERNVIGTCNHGNRGSVRKSVIASFHGDAGLLLIWHSFLQHAGNLFLVCNAPCMAKVGQAAHFSRQQRCKWKIRLRSSRGPC